MTGRFRNLIAAILGATLLGTLNPAVAWQSPGDLPQAPRLNVDDQGSVTPAGIEIIEDEVVDEALPAPGAAPGVTAPKIVPAEEIIAPSVNAEPTSRRKPLRTKVAPPTIDTAAEVVSPDTTTPKTARLKTTLFKQAEPGVTSAEELTQLWGAAKSEKKNGNETTRTYELDPFPRVDAVIADDVLQSIVIHFAQPGDVAQASSRLGLDDIEPAVVNDDQGKPVALKFPERGVTLEHPAPGQPNKVARVILRPLSADAFIARVHGDREHRWGRNLADLETALSLNEDDDRIWWLKSEILAEQGEFREAALAIEQALLARPDSPLYQLTAARLIAEAGSYEDAIAATLEVYNNKQLPRLLKARAALQLGDLLGKSPQRDFAKALELHQYCIQLALPLASSAESQSRRAAKHLLIDAHAAIASDIAQGQWQKKVESVPQWLDRAAALADDYVEREDGNASIHFDLVCQRLEAYAWLDGKLDPGEAIANLQKRAGQLKQDAEDPTYRRHLDWLYAKAMIDAVDIERARGNSEKALQYGQIADETMSQLADDDWKRETTQFQLSRLYFLLGSVQAIRLQDHSAAVQWFDKALDDISRPAPDRDWYRTARRGQWMVSMGISYWQADDKETGLRLTETGLKLIKAAQAEGAVKPKALAVPYNNLAFMHEQMGNQKKASRFAEMAGKLEASVQR